MFAKALCFFLVPTLLFCVMATTRLNGGGERPAGNSWRSLEEAGIHLALPAGLELVDPLGTETPLGDDRWAMEWPARNRTHGGLVRGAEGAFQVLIFAGRHELLDPQLRQARGHYDHNRMVQRDEPRSWRTADGLEVEILRVRSLPGVLTGVETSLVLGWARRGKTLLVFNAGGPSADLDLTLLERVVSGVRIQD